MCTTGAKILRPGREYVLFKNRDFKRAAFDDRVSATAEALGVLGLETWDGLDPESDRFSGFSVGFNQDLICCDSNVKTVPDGENYDRLVQAVVEACSSVDEAVGRVRALVERQTYCWANMLVATAREVAAIEVRDGRIEVERDPRLVVRANHHVCLGANEDDDDTVTTETRYRLALESLSGATSLEDIFALVKTHAPGMDYGVCNHGLYETVYSYVVHRNEGQTTFYVLQGHPCEGGEFVAIPVAPGTPADLSRYPSNRAV